MAILPFFRFARQGNYQGLLDSFPEQSLGSSTFESLSTHHLQQVLCCIWLISRVLMFAGEMSDAFLLHRKLYHVLHASRDRYNPIALIERREKKTTVRNPREDVSPFECGRDLRVEGSFQQVALMKVKSKVTALSVVGPSV